ncbi:MAG: RNA polymerase sigma factor [Planctomycetota bacterium]
MRGGDQLSQSLFYRRYLGAVISFVRGQANNLEDVEEIADDTMLAAISDIGRLRDRKNVVGWLRAIARQRIADFYQAKRNRYGKRLGRKGN